MYIEINIINIKNFKISVLLVPKLKKQNLTSVVKLDYFITTSSCMTVTVFKSVNIREAV